jgi:hypothetical protein
VTEDVLQALFTPAAFRVARLRRFNMRCRISLEYSQAELADPEAA